MKINRIEIENFKGFKQNTFELHDRFTLVIGENGVGKTSLLEALTVGVGAYLGGIDGVRTRNILKDDVRLEWDRVGDAQVTKELQFPVKITCHGIVQEHEVSWERAKNSEKGNTTRVHAEAIITLAKDTHRQIVTDKNHDVILPLLCYQSVGRLFSQKKERWTDVFATDKMSRFVGYIDCVDSESNIKLFVNWLKRMTLIKLQKNKVIGELQAVERAVETFMKQLTANTEGHVGIFYDFEEEEVVVQIGSLAIPLRKMSAGFRTIIGMIADLAFRAAILNPQLREDAVRLTPGIVLIDELDLHLHPQWQWRIVDCLTTVFPNVQFVATTHSPIILSSCKDCGIIDLSLHKVDDTVVSKQEPTPYGWLVEDVLEDMMAAPIRVPDVQQEIDQVKTLYMKKFRGGLTDDEHYQLKELTNKLHDTLPEGDPAVTLARMDAVEANMESEEHD